MIGTLRLLLARTGFRLCLVVWCFGLVLVDIGAAAQGRTVPGVMFVAYLPLLALGLAQSLALIELLDRLDGHPLLKWPAIVAAVVAAGALQTFADFEWLRALALTVAPSWRAWALDTDPSRVVTIYILYAWTMALCVALIGSARAGDSVKISQARAAMFEAAAAQAEVAALRLQLNPHFLFNTLNGIVGLIVHRKEEQAEEMIGRLADFLRASFSSDPNALIPLRQELDTIRSYLDIEEVRFAERMRVGYALDERALDWPVPNFLLQPVVENAIKYGVARAPMGAVIELAAKVEDGALRLSVVDTLIDPGEGAAHENGEARLSASGVGLANTRQRLQLVYGGHAAIEATAISGGYRCDILLPAAPPAIGEAAE